jgi:hypothetical protein
LGSAFHRVDYWNACSFLYSEGKKEMSEMQTSGEIGEIKRFTTHDEEYRALLRHMQETLNKRTAEDGPYLFRTKTQMSNKDAVVQVLKKAGEDTSKLDLPVVLNQVYLGSLTEEVQYHTCACCANFLHKYGGLVTLHDGVLRAAFWDAETFPQENFYHAFVKNIQTVVERGEVKGTFRSERRVWGDFIKGDFEHFAIAPSSELIFSHLKLSDRQKQAVDQEDFDRMVGVLNSEPYSVATLTDLVRIIDADTMNGCEKIAGVGRWLYQLASERKATQNRKIQTNLLWHGIARAAAGWTHPETTLVGTVINDLFGGASFDDLKKKFGSKVRADKYQVATTPPSDGQIDDAEKLFEKLGLEPALRRRIAYIEDVPQHAYEWAPLPDAPVVPEEKTSTFGHLKKKLTGEKKSLDLPPTIMSWNKFIQELLPSVTSMEYMVPAVRDYFVGLITAAVENPPIIFAHDYEDERNTVISYTRHENDANTGAMIGVVPAIWNLAPGFCTVKGIIKVPNRWGSRPRPNVREQLILVLEGAYDRNYVANKQGLSIFSPALRADLHSIKAVIEAYSRNGLMEGDPEKQVAGPTIVRNAAFPARMLKVQTMTGERVVVIDRWE